MSKQRFDSVWGAIEDTSQEAVNTKVRLELMIMIGEHLRQHHLIQAKAAALFDVTQPRISDLVQGKIERFSLDTLVNMAAAAGLRVKISPKQVA